MSDGLTLDNLKGMNPQQGFLLYTSAEVERRGSRLSGPISVDQVLMNLGYRLDPATDRPGEMTIADREIAGVRESVRYHPLAPRDPRETRDLGMRTRINFLGGGPSDAAYDVARVLLDRGYDVAVPPLNRNFDRLHRFSGGSHLSEVVMLGPDS